MNSVKIEWDDLNSIVSLKEQELRNCYSVIFRYNNNNGYNKLLNKSFGMNYRIK